MALLVFSTISTMTDTPTPSTSKPKLSWGGSMTQSASASNNVALLNKALPDATNWMRSTLDISATVTAGKEAFGHDAVKIFSTFRHRGFWGSDAMRSGDGKLKIGDILGFEHTHTIQRPPLWMLESWCDFSLDAARGTHSEGLNHFKVGYFPFSLGTGASLGENYGASKDFLGVFIRSNDYYMPGILFYGSAFEDFFKYNVYLARPEAKSATTAQTLGMSKQHLTKTILPFGGSFRDDTILASQLDFCFGAKNTDVKKTKFTLSPYALAFFSPDSKIEIDSDASVNFYTFGLSANLGSENFSVGFDVATNYGKQLAKEVDRNAANITVDSLGNLVETYSHVQATNGSSDSSNYTEARLTPDLKKELGKNLHRDGQPFSVAGAGYISKADRIRSSYTNLYRGKMGVIEAEYKFKNSPYSIAAAAGLATGGTNPNKTADDAIYNGFLGINESFSIKKVPSVIILGGANVRRPLTVSDDQITPKLKDFSNGSLTDIIFIGAGIKRTPNKDQNTTFGWGVNTLAFWKELENKKVVAGDKTNTVKFGTESASKFLGIETNLALSWSPIENMSVIFGTGIFFPGQYYKDMKGATVDDSTTKILEAVDLDKVDNTSSSQKAKIAYALGSDTCYIFSFDIKYKF